MIVHPAALDAAFGTVAWTPKATLTPIRGGVAGTPLTPTEGSIRQDWTQWPRTTVSATLPTDLTPTETEPPLSPYGDRVRLDVSLTISGVPYAFTVGTFDVHTVEIDRPAGQIRVEAVSPEARVNEDRYTTKDATPAGLSSAVIVGIVRRTLGPTWPYVLSVTTDPTLAVGAFPLDSDVWPTVEAIADAAGWDVSFRSDGTLLIRDTPKKGTPTTTFAAGDRGTLTGYVSRRQWAYNAVGIVYEENTGAIPARRVGLWQDTAAGSVTNVAGPYGRHTRRDLVPVDAGKLPTAAAANAAALDVARRAAAGFRSLDLRTIPAPWVECGDTVRVRMLGSLTEDHVVASVEWPLSMLDVATITTTDSEYTGSGFLVVAADPHGNPNHP